jgi:hypothetical protein
VQSVYSFSQRLRRRGVALPYFTTKRGNPGMSAEEVAQLNALLDK